MRKLVIFGSGQIAQLAQYYFSTDSDYEAVAFTVDPEYATAAEFCSLPLVSFTEVASRYPPLEHDMFIALSYTRLNQARKEKYLAAKALGYRMVSYVSSRATVLNDGRIGENCFILEDNTIQPFATIGHNVVLWSGNHIGHHSRISDHCFIASHAVISGEVIIGESCFIGVNVTVRNGVTVGPRCVLGAGTLLLANAEPNGVYSPEATARARVPSNRLRRI